ncbi:gamma carbonic anhydrase family protein [Sphingomonas paeninsulae]|uniref:Gamma carbonic anhydrase family protein n=1 Tax=Sphingomonas paeninsulae TaxID=2319844 RepID=A0A494TNU5_SPHPE|nr:gamma carbonic anhydrase family protein [Sphingomonas paeninsulae]AYJ87476.1 gamma carbonic anhydrase family protein [Sphingomonas paeninsulae]
MVDPTLIPFDGVTPTVDDSAFVAAGSRVIGKVTIGAESSIWYNCVLRGDVNHIVIGARTNIQDGTVIHVDSPKGGGDGLSTIIGNDVLIGHMVMLHGSVLRDHAFVGLGCIVMDGCTIESDAMLAAGSMLTPGKTMRSGELWMGRPAKKLRDLSAEEIARNRLAAAGYVALAQKHKTTARAESDPIASDRLL